MQSFSCLEQCKGQALEMRVSERENSLLELEDRMQELKLKMQSQVDLQVVVAFESENFLLVVPAEARVEDFETKLVAKLSDVHGVVLPDPPQLHVVIRHYSKDFQKWFRLTQDGYSALKVRDSIELTVSRVDQPPQNDQQPAKQASPPQPQQSELTQIKLPQAVLQTVDLPPVQAKPQPPVGLDCPQIIINNIVGSTRTVVPPNARQVRHINQTLTLQTLCFYVYLWGNHVYMPCAVGVIVTNCNNL